MDSCFKTMLKLGKYHHYKGKYYEVIGFGKHSETLEDYVYYRCLYKNKISQTWVRPLKMFQKKIKLDDGREVFRFEYCQQ
jgi:hypothetical protein